MWQAEADNELTLSASPATAVGQILLTMAKFCTNTVVYQKGLGVNRSWLAHIQAENSIEVIFWLQKSALPLEY